MAAAVCSTRLPARQQCQLITNGLLSRHSPADSHGSDVSDDGGGPSVDADVIYLFFTFITVTEGKIYLQHDAYADAVKISQL